MTKKDWWIYNDQPLSAKSLMVAPGGGETSVLQVKIGSLLMYIKVNEYENNICNTIVY